MGSGGDVACDVATILARTFLLVRSGAIRGLWCNYRGFPEPSPLLDLHVLPEPGGLTKVGTVTDRQWQYTEAIVECDVDQIKCSTSHVEPSQPRYVL